MDGWRMGNTVCIFIMFYSADETIPFISTTTHSAFMLDKWRCWGKKGPFTGHVWAARCLGWIIKSTLQLQVGFDLPQEAIFLLNLPLHVLTPSTMQMLGAAPVIAHADCQPGWRSFNSEEMVINTRAHLRLHSPLMPAEGRRRKLRTAAGREMMRGKGGTGREK